jgi:hypothetical protein
VKENYAILFFLLVQIWQKKFWSLWILLTTYRGGNKNLQQLSSSKVAFKIGSSGEPTMKTWLDVTRHIVKELYVFIKSHYGGIEP